MAPPPPSCRTSSSSSWPAVPLILSLLLLACTADADDADQLTVGNYDKTCPGVQSIVRSVMASRVAADPTMAPAMLRLFFHDCFVNGCDASVLLDATPYSESEKDARPNQRSLRGFDVVDAIKSRLERACPATVSCADVLALAARDAVALLGGPSWTVQLGRRDSRGAAGRAAAERGLPSPRDGLANLTAAFRTHGLGARDLAALSGAHTVGAARCRSFRDRVYGDKAAAGDIDPAFAARRRGTCQSGGDDAFAPLDEQTPLTFDNAYYRDLVARRGLLASDQALYGGGAGPLDRLVEMYSTDASAFARDFASAMVKMGRIPPPQGMQMEVRRVCNKVN